MAIDYLSVTQAAQELGLTVGRIRQMLLAQEIPGEKLGAKQWAIRKADVARLKKSRLKNSSGQSRKSG